MTTPSATVLAAFGATDAHLEVLGGGHVHHTYAARSADGAGLVIQAVNPAVFGDAWVLADRTVAVTEALDRRPDELLHNRRSQRTTDGATAFEDADGTVWRAYGLVDRVVAANRAQSQPSPATVAEWFGRFDRRAAAVGIEAFLPTPFHDLARRVDEYRRALEEPHQPLPDAIEQALDGLCRVVESAKRLRRRVVHNDAKPANLLVDEVTGAAVAIIDLDLVDHGSILDDLGDLVRSQAFPDERLDVAVVGEITAGYMAGLDSLLDHDEWLALPRAGEIITTELALRRATDHLSGAGHFADGDHGENLAQAGRQIARAEALVAARERITPVVKEAAERYLGPSTG